MTLELGETGRRDDEVEGHVDMLATPAEIIKTPWTGTLERQIRFRAGGSGPGETSVKEAEETCARASRSSPSGNAGAARNGCALAAGSPADAG